MLVHTTEHPHFQALRSLLTSDKDDYKSMQDLLAKDPLVLACHGFVQDAVMKPPNTTHLEINLFAPPLIEAISRNKLGQARAILEMLSDPDIAKRIMDKYRQDMRMVEKTPHNSKEKYDRIEEECPHENPLYATLPDNQDKMYLPHAFATSPEMIQLLHDHGYNLNVIEKGYQLSFLDRYIDNHVNHHIRQEDVENYPDPSTSRDSLWQPPLHMPVDALRKAIKLGMDINGRQIGDESGHYCGVVEYALKKTLHDISASQLAQFQPNTALGFLKNFADAGIDCREVIKSGLKKYATNRDKDSEYIQDSLKRYGDCALKDYQYTAGKNEQSKEARSKCIDITCACATFPELLSTCVKVDVSAGNREQTDELLSYLDPYWRDQYKHVIQNAESTLARKSPLDRESSQSPLLNRFRNDDSPIRRGSP